MKFHLLWKVTLSEVACLLITSFYKLLVAGITKAGPTISYQETENSIRSSEL